MGRLATGWIKAHCVVPEGDTAGDPFTPTVDHAVYLANYYEVRPTAKIGEKNVAFAHRVGLWMAAQKIGKAIDLRLTVENLLNAPFRFVHGANTDALVNRWEIGTTAMLYATYSNE